MSDNPIFDRIESGEYDEFKPDISKRVRTIIYFIVMISSPLTTLLAGMLMIWMPNSAISEGVNASGILLVGFIGTIGGLFGVIYRPTRQV